MTLHPIKLSHWDDSFALEESVALDESFTPDKNRYLEESFTLDNVVALDESFAPDKNRYLDESFALDNVVALDERFALDNIVALVEVVPVASWLSLRTEWNLPLCLTHRDDKFFFFKVSVEIICGRMQIIVGEPIYLNPWNALSEN